MQETRQGTSDMPGCGLIAVTIAAVPVTLGYALLCLVRYGSGSDPFGLVSVTSLVLIGLGCSVIAVVAAAGAIRHLVARRRWRAAAISMTLAAGLLVTAGLVGWIAVVESTWWLVLASSLITVAGTLTVLAGRRPVDWSAVLVVSLLGGAFGWGIESHLDVDIRYDPSPMRAAEADAPLIFVADQSGTFEVRLGSGCSGTRIEAGYYGPGWDEVDIAHERAVPLGDRGLAPGDNVVTVCVRSGIASGQDAVVVTVDDTPPPVPTLEVAPITVDGDQWVAATRTLRLSGTIDEVAHIDVTMNDMPIGQPAIERHGAGLSFVLDWEVTGVLDRATFGVVATDDAGNASRSHSIHVRFVDADGTG